ncbi:MAG: hypothetical protein SGI88_16935 [Candidatus Hydrogenedentes bacterium]|nr:hypothetical protein [Candidatus Hydrogenedentota bacterium]
MTEKQFRWCVSALIVFAALLAYANTFTNDFVWDDASSIILHEHVQDPSKFLRLFMEDQHAFGRGQGNFYRPLVSLSFMIEYWCSRPPAPVEGGMAPLQVLSPFIFHVSNTFWHALVAVLFFGLLTILDTPRAVRALAPLLYAVHPLHTEAVAYISGRADSMAAAFLLAALCCALSMTLKRPALWCGVFFALALLSKESALIFPVVLLCAAVVLRKPREMENGEPKRRSLISPLVVSGVILGVYAALRMTVLRFSDATGTGAAPPFSQRILDAGQALALYLKLMFVPTGLHMERTLAGVPGWVAVLGWAMFGLLILLAIGAVVTRKQRLAFALGFFLITWFPVSGIFPLNAPMAEHWMYLPMFGFVWALYELAWLAVGPTPLRYALYAASYAAILVLTLITTERNHDWRNNQTIYSATLESNPNSIRVHYNLGVTYEDLIGNLSGARRHFEEVLALYQQRKIDTGTADVYQDEMEAHLSLARIYQRENRPDRAARHYETLRRLEATDSNAAMLGRTYIEYTRLLLDAGQKDDAAKLLQEGKDRIPALKQQFDELENRQQNQNTPTAPDAAKVTVPPQQVQQPTTE